MIDENDIKVMIREFFDHYLEEVLPKQLEAIITAHNRDVTAHAYQINQAIQAGTLRLKLWVCGALVTGGIGGGFGLAKLLSSFF